MIKKVVGILKMARVAIPALIFGTTVFGMVYGIKLVDIADDKIEDAKKQILKTEKVVQLQERDLSIYQQQYEDGIITTSQFSKSKDYVESIDYVDDIINLPQLEEQKAMLKQTEKSAKTTKVCGWSLYSVSTAATGLATLGLIYSYCSHAGRTKMKELILEGKEDFNYKEIIEKIENQFPMENS